MTKYKYDLVDEKDSATVVDGDLPQYLLGNTPEDAEALFEYFERYINGISASYSYATGIDKSEFFGEAVMALGTARRDFDPKRSNSFDAFAKYIITDALNECVRNNISIVKVPVYVYKAHKIINRIKKLAFDYALEPDEVLYTENYEVPKEIELKIREEKQKLENAAKRASVKYRELIRRAEYVPIVLSKEEMMQETLQNTNQRHEAVLAKIIVDTVVPMLDEDEKVIAELLMKDCSRAEICKRLGRSDDWVKARMDKIKGKITGKFLSKKHG